MSDEDCGGQEAPVEGPDSEFGVLRSWSRGQKVLHPSRDQYLELARALYDAGYLMCVDVTAVDFCAAKQQRTLPDGVVVVPSYAQGIDLRVAGGAVGVVAVSL